MEKKTLLAVVLSSLVLIIFYTVQGFLSPAANESSAARPAPSAVAAVPDQSAVVEVPLELMSAGELAPPDNLAPAGEFPAVSDKENIPAAANQTETSVDSGPAYEEWTTIETELVTVILSNAGGDVISWKLKKHNDKDDFVEMVLPGTSESHAFTIAFGGLNAQPLSSLFYVNRPLDSEYIIEFYRDFLIPNTTSRFRLTKRYEFKPNDYMFELTVSLDGGHTVSDFNFGGSAYTLSFGPQIGPRFEKLDNHYDDYRRYFVYNSNGKLKQEKVNESKPVTITPGPNWAAITGKYFTLIAAPFLPPGSYSLNFSEKPEAGIPSASRLNIVRPALNTSRATDVYRFYLGPKSQEVLEVYNHGYNEKTGYNAFNLTNMQFVEVASSRGILSPLEKVLKWFLFLFYRMIPNYGVAIILLTLLVKIVFFPLTKKSSEATLRMQAVAPKIKELQEKYKDNRQKLNIEMAELYKKEGYNPISGCLPMLLQLPIFIAMYSLFNNHFDLRGAMFIPGWIPDLSRPEAIWNFPPGFRVPIFGWTALRLLPFIYVGSQLLYGKVTQTPDQRSNTQMKMILYVMPIVFFFILYDVPSGLLIYWIFSNLLTMVQQLAINKYLAPKRAAQAAAQAAAAAAAAPPKKKKQK